MVNHIFRRRDLGALDAILWLAMLVVAVFTWTERSVVVDPDFELSRSWEWQLWQAPPLVVSVIGVWILWRNTHRVPWVRTLALSLLAVSILINQYTNSFGDHALNVWYTIDPLFLAFAIVAVYSAWGLRKDPGPTAVTAQLVAISASALGVALFIYAYFTNDNETAFEIIDPFVIVALLIWAIAARRVEVNLASDSAPRVS